MIVKELNVECIWGGTLAGILIKSDVAATDESSQTTKIIGVHGWLDNLNSLLPLAKELIERDSNYEIYLYDRAGHGFSSHLPKGSDYSAIHNAQDLRTIIQTLGWNKGKYSIIAHSYGAMIGLVYAASYAEEVSCFVVLDALPRTEATLENVFKISGSRIDASLQFYNKAPRTFDTSLTFEKALELTKISRPGITDEAAKLLTERSIRRNPDNKLYLSRDESLKMLSLFPFTDGIIQSAIETTKASILFIGATIPQWPRDQKSIDLFKEHHSTFEMTLINGPHHLHMTHVDEVVDRIEQFFTKYLH